MSDEEKIKRIYDICDMTIKNAENSWKLALEKIQEILINTKGEDV